MAKIGPMWAILTTYCIFIYGCCNGVHIKGLQDDMEVTISRGAQVNPINDVLLYTDFEYLVFTVPDVPDPPAISKEHSCGREGDEACELFNGLQHGVKDISDLLTVINRVLTTKGVSSVDPSFVSIPEEWLKIVDGVNVASTGPTDDLISAAGKDWVSDAEAHLALRKFLHTGQESLSTREKRWIGKVVKAGVKLAMYASGSNDVYQIFDKLFVGDKSILSFLTKRKVLSKKDFLVFAELPHQVSQLQEATKQLFRDVLNSSEVVKQMTAKVQHEIQNYQYKLSTIEDAFLMEQNTLADVIRVMYTSVVYTVHFAAYDECRSSKIPVAFVPPMLLQKRLIEVQDRLPENIRFAIPVEDYQKYYRLPVSQCVFDSNGGIIRIKIPLVEKSRNLQLYEFKALRFAHEDYTCAIETPSAFIVKDIKNNEIFPVTETEEELCQPRTTGMCKVPYASADSSNNFCVSVMLSGEPAHVVKESCRLQCYPGNQPIIKQVSDNVFIGVHLSATDIKMQCPGEVLRMQHVVLHGNVRFQTVCGCQIFNGEKLIAQSTTKTCDDTQAPKIDVLMPVQMTTFTDLLPFSEDGYDKTVFSHSAEIYNKDFEVTEATLEEDLIETPFRISAVVWNFVQTMFMSYLFFKVNTVAGTLMAVTTRLPAVQAADSHTCELPYDAYVLLYLILTLLVLLLLPQAICKIFRCAKTSYNEHVELVARRYAHDDV